MRGPARVSLRLAAWLCILGALAQPAAAQPGTIERIIVQGLFRMTEAAFLHAFGIAVGDPYDEVQIRRRFQALWEMGLFADISIESENGPEGGKVLVIKIEERPELVSVEYQKSKAVSQSEIEEMLKERDIRLDIGRPLNMEAIAATEQAIRDILEQKGFRGSVVRHRIDKEIEKKRSVFFSITPGRKTKIKKIDFTGNEVFRDKQLKKSLQLNKAYRWYWPWSKKALYHPIKWDQDSNEIVRLYRNAGYLDVELRPPIVELKSKDDKKGSEPPEPAEVKPPEAVVSALEKFRKRAEREGLRPKKQAKLDRRVEMLETKLDKRLEKRQLKAQPKGKQWAYLTVPVIEGPQYKTGEITVTGNEVLTDEEILGQMRSLLREGSVLQENRLDLGVDVITRRYEDRGHLYASIVRQIERRPDEPVADVRVSVSEDKPYHVGRIDFTGNTTTHDRVLRREVVIAEGELFSRTRLDLTLRKLNQLGYAQVPEEPVIEPIDDPDEGADGDDEVRIRFDVQEQGRNEIQVGGGYSGLDGAFFTGVYSTRNFLGRGQIVALSLTVGGRSDRYSISFTEPYFLNRPYLFGAQVFLQDVNFGGTLRSTSKGLGLQLGKRIRNFGRVQLAYRWENVSSTSVVAGGFTAATAENTVSSITPSFLVNTINNPYRPTRGRNFNVSVQIAGGPLGGDTSYLKPQVGFQAYRRLTKKSFLGLNTRVGYVTEWADGSPVNSVNINGVPSFQRFWLGGDTFGPRVFETRTITPLRYIVIGDNGGIVEGVGDPTNIPTANLVTNAVGQPALLEVGGNRFYLAQLEWVYPFNQAVELVGFLDIGDSLFEDQVLNFGTMRASAGAELRFHLPVFPVPLRLIYGRPLRQLVSDRTSNFQFAIGRSF